jgi:flagellin-like hook-associated protein FlgL
VLSDNQQDYLAVEFDALADSLETIADNTSFNGVSILQNNGLVPPPAGLLKNTYEIKGADASTVMVAVNVLSLDSLATATQTLNIGTATGSPVNAIALLDLQLDLLADSRAELGTCQH